MSRLEAEAWRLKKGWRGGALRAGSLQRGKYRGAMATDVQMVVGFSAETGVCVRVCLCARITLIHTGV